MSKNGRYLNCKYCQTSFYASLSRIRAGKKFCSRSCSDVVTLIKVGHPSYRYWQDKKRPGLFTNTSFKEGLTPWNKGLKWDRMSGENNPRWVGGAIKHPDKRVRQSIEYKLWRKSVFERDNYICQFCKVRGGQLQADHIKPFSLYPTLRFTLENGRTLCVECHKKTPTYARNAEFVRAVMSL